MACRETTLAHTIRTCRLARGWSHEELARRIAEAGEIGFRQSDVSRLERGVVGLPRRARLERISRVLDLSMGELLARCGWGQPIDPPEATPPSPREHVAPGIFSPDRLHSAEPVINDRLPKQVAGSRELLSHTEEMLQRSAESIDRVSQVLKSHHASHDPVALWSSIVDGSAESPAGM